MEVGFVTRKAKNIYASIDLTQPPYMFVYGGQSYAKAFDNVRTALRAGTAVATQPFFEAALAGSSLCTTSCTAGVASNFAGSFTGQGWWGLWNNLQPSYVFGPATQIAQVSDYVEFAAYGHARYNAAFVSYRVRNWKGLTLDTNLTYAHSLDDTVGCRHDCDIAAYNNYHLSYDYGTSTYDRKFVFTLFGVYNLPIFQHSTNAFARKVVGGWAVTPIYTWFSGTPLRVGDGGPGAIMLVKNSFGASRHTGVAGSNGVGTAGDPSKGGTGFNLFADPNAVRNSFRPWMLSMDTRTSAGGDLRGQHRWTLEMGVQKKFRITERLSTTFNANFYNIFNHVMFGDPGLDWLNPQGFGVLGGQMNVPRNIELALRVDF
jgi:hypothetical protein